MKTTPLELCDALRPVFPNVQYNVAFLMLCKIPATRLQLAISLDVQHDDELTEETDTRHAELQTSASEFFQNVSLTPFLDLMLTAHRAQKKSVQS